MARARCSTLNPNDTFSSRSLARSLVLAHVIAIIVEPWKQATRARPLIAPRSISNDVNLNVRAREREIP